MGVTDLGEGKGWGLYIYIKWEIFCLFLLFLGDVLLRHLGLILGLGKTCGKKGALRYRILLLEGRGGEGLFGCLQYLGLFQ